MRKIYLILLVVAVLGTGALWQSYRASTLTGDTHPIYGTRNTDFAPAFAAQFRAPHVVSEGTLSVQTLASGLDKPWAITVLPAASGYLITEWAGSLHHVSRDGVVSPAISGLPAVVAKGQGGLFDVILAPDFATSRYIYWTYAKDTGGGLTALAVARARLSDDLSALVGADDIFVQSPPVESPKHFGGRMVFDDLGRLYVTVGERSDAKHRVLAQDLSTTFGKVVRLNGDGSIPTGNPYIGETEHNAAIFSYGHRNPVGIVLRNGEIFAVEHGPKGGDELNQVTRGANFGWPLVGYGERYSGRPEGTGKAVLEGTTQPTYFWDPVIAPGDMLTYEGAEFAQWQGDLLIAALRGGVVRLRLEGGLVVAEERLLPQLGRTRAIAIDHDGSLLVATNGGKAALYRVRRAE